MKADPKQYESFEKIDGALKLWKVLISVSSRFAIIPPGAMVGQSRVEHNRRTGSETKMPMFATRAVSGLIAGSLLAILPAHAASEEVLYSFQSGGDGASPFAGLIEVDGALYGTTAYGNGSANCPAQGGIPSGCGTVFKVTEAGRETVLYSFQGGSDGATPFANLFYASDGTLYGTTFYGGGSANCPGGNGVPSGCGTVFKVTKTGVETVVHSFQGGSDGAAPEGGLIEFGGELYGITQGGGDAVNCPGGDFYPSGCGTVFKVTKAGVATLYSFTGGSDGAYPSAGLIEVDGALYGTTAYGGGSANCPAGNGLPSGCGTVFKVTKAGREKVLYSFLGASDGANPFAGLTNVGGTLYGTASSGGLVQCLDLSIGCGTVFKVTKAGDQTVVYSFQGGSDGGNPYAGLIGVGGTLYGTASSGGLANSNCFSGCGTVFKLTKAGVFTGVYSFQGGSDGSNPEAALLNVGGKLYSTTLNGGGSANCSGSCGTVFRVTQ